jgi:predicted transposase YdaD
MLFERFPKLSREEILMIVGLPLQELRHTRAVQEILEEGRLEGRQEGRLEGRQQGRLEGHQEGRQEGAPGRSGSGPTAGSRRSGHPAPHTTPRQFRRW